MTTRCALFSCKTRLAAGLRPDPLGTLSAPPNLLGTIRGWGPGEGDREEREGGEGATGKGGMGKKRE